MPHLGQLPGTSLSTPGHIGQKYAAVTAARATAGPSDAPAAAAA
ncbi:MAG TPA: hypothetical protein VLH36_04270 [Steroidobacteraceae bacterium]|nr:hypothetical protein [Steroidobacteraceae bacterium]